MAHVVVDQAKGEAPVHERQAPLQRRITVCAHEGVEKKKDQTRQKEHNDPLDR